MAKTAEAVRSGRFAIEVISRELAAANTLSASQALRLEGIPGATGEGNRRDDDGDGRRDEERIDGRDNDADATDLHVLLTQGTIAANDVYERHNQLGIFEVGDVGVDEDTLFHRDTLTFVNGTTRITYRIQTWEGRENTLVRVRRQLLPPLPEPQDVIDPIAFDVLSLGFAYFDPNWLITGTNQPWVAEWNSNTNPGPFRFPPTVRVTISVYSGRLPWADFQALGTDQPIPVVTLSTQVGVESALVAYRSQF
jgi:hypothetical protein